MPQPDLQLGGGYTYQWRCGILLALNYFHKPVAYNKALHALVDDFLGCVDEVHLEGERIGSSIELEDLNLLGRGPRGEAERKILIQVKAKGKGTWTPSDELLRKALYRLHRSRALDDADNSRFVFLTNQPFNDDLDEVQAAIEACAAADSDAVADVGAIATLASGLAKWAVKKKRPPLDRERFLRMLARLTLINLMPLETVAANVQTKLQAYGRQDWEQAYDTLFARFAELSEQKGGGRVTRAMLTKILGEPRGPELRTHTLPPPVADFTGRTADVQELVDYLMSAVVPIAGIRGMGGVGKTQLALAVAQRLGDAYPDQLMIELQAGAEPLSPQALMGQVFHAFQPDSKLHEAADELQRQYRNLLAGRRGLLLLDNAANGEQVRPLLPAPDGWAVIVTSRSRFRLEGGKLYDVELLSLDDAKALLARMLSDGGRQDLDGTGLEPLARLCGRLPLALRLAASYLTSTDRLLETYLQDLERARLKYLKDPEGEQSVRAVLQLSVKRLSKMPGDVVRRWRDLAVFPAPFDATAAAAVWTLGQHDAQDVLDALRQQSLVESEGAAYSLHDLLREIALEVPPADEVYYSHAEHFLVRGSEAPGFLAFDAVLPHLLSAFAWMQSRKDRRAQQWLNDFPKRTAFALGLRVNAREHVSVLEAAIEAARQLQDRHGERDHLGTLGNTWADLGQNERAIGYYKRALEISRAIGDRRSEGTWMGNLGYAYAELDRVEEAIECYNEALKISREVDNKRVVAHQLGNLGLAYVDLGRVKQAVQYHEQALTISLEIKDLQGQGAALADLGVAYAHLGEIARAIKYYGYALDISRGIGDRRREGMQLGWLGNAYADQGRSHEAVELYEAALAIGEEISDPRLKAEQLRNLGDAHAALGRVEQAIVYHEEAQKISRGIKFRRMESAALRGLGAAYAAMGQIKRSVETYQEALTISREIGDCRGESIGLGGLGQACAAADQTQQAIQRYRQALAISLRIKDARGEADHSWGLALQYEQAGDLARSAKLMRVRVDYEQKIGHPDAEAHAAIVAGIRLRAAEASTKSEMA